jgi:hypothetical protein
MSENKYFALLEEARVPVVPLSKAEKKHLDTERVFQGIPTVAATPGGTLWAAWFSGGQGESPLNFVLLVRSNDRGVTWSEPLLILDPPGNVRAWDPLLWLDPLGRLWFFWTQSHTLHDGRNGVWWMCADDPDSDQPKWSKPQRLCDGVMLNKPTVLQDNSWLFPVSRLPSKFLENESRMLPGFLRSNLEPLVSPQERGEIDERAGACVLRSTDHGKTFHEIGNCRVPEPFSTHNEHMVIENKDGGLCLFVRTTYGIARSDSVDRGKTWSSAVPTGWPHPSSRFFIGRLQAGALLLVKHGPLTPPDFSTEKPRHKRVDLMAFLSDDDGVTWSPGLLLHQGVCSYPHACQLPDGTICVIFDRGRRAEKEILLASFSEDLLRAPSKEGQKEIQHSLVNKATGIILPEDNWAQWKGGADSQTPLIFTGI